MLVKLWKDGDEMDNKCHRRKPPTIAIQLASSDVTYGQPPVSCNACVDEADSDNDLEYVSGN